MRGELCSQTSPDVFLVPSILVARPKLHGTEFNWTRSIMLAYSSAGRHWKLLPETIWRREIGKKGNEEEGFPGLVFCPFICSPFESILLGLSPNIIRTPVSALNGFHCLHREEHRRILLSYDTTPLVIRPLKNQSPSFGPPSSPSRLPLRRLDSTSNNVVIISDDCSRRETD